MSSNHSGSDGLESCVASIEALVLDELEPGQRLPSEADLTSLTGLSRVTVREALKVLSGRGLVEVRRGTRAVVREPDSSVLSGFLSIAIRRDPRGVLDLVEVRQALEVQSASLAARNATRASIAAIDAALKEMEAASLADPAVGLEAYHRADVAFHESLALASGNRMLAFILEGLAEALEYSFRQSATGRFAHGGTFEEALESHRRVLDCISAGDSRGAAQAMRAHLKLAERDMRNSLKS